MSFICEMPEWPVFMKVAGLFLTSAKKKQTDGLLSMGTG